MIETAVFVLFPLNAFSIYSKRVHVSVSEWCCHLHLQMEQDIFKQNVNFQEYLFKIHFFPPRLYNVSYQH